MRLSWALPAVALLAVLGGCVSIPAASAPVAVTALPQTSLDESGVQIEELTPRDGQQPDEVVRGFLAASTARDRSIARQYLTPAAAHEWSDAAGVTVIERDFAAVPKGDNTVTLSGRVVGTVDRNGVYSGGAADLGFSFNMQQVDGQWRINNPPSGVILTLDDFTRAFTQLSLYFLDPTETRVVPDPRWFVAGSSARTNSLVEALLRGPSAFLAPAVRTELGDGVTLVSNVQESRDVQIAVTGLGQRSPASLQGLSAQLVWTLKQLSIDSLSITSDGQVLSVPTAGTVQHIGDWQSFDPDAVPADAVGHFISAGAVWTVDGNRIPGAAGAGAYGLVSAAATADQSLLAGVSGAPGNQNLLVGDYGGDLVAVLPGITFTPPSWSGTAQEVWTVRDGTDVIRVPLRAAPQVVSAPDLVELVRQLGPVTGLRLSRDGTRAALAIGVTGQQELYLARLASSGGTVELSGFTRLAPDLRGVSDVAWSSAGQLTVVAVDPADGRSKPWRVSIDGVVVTEQTVSGLPGQPVTVAAAPGRATLVAAGAPDSGSNLWRLSSNTWLTLIPGQPVFTGTAPFYPG